MLSWSNITMGNLNQTAVEFSSSELIFAEKLIINSISQGSALKLLKGSQMTISNSSFTNLGSPSLIKGAAIFVSNSNLTESASIFSNNMAMSGAAIDLSCDLTSICSYSFTNSTFENNTATNTGGAIRYNLYRPILSDITFLNNSAAYGNNIGSYVMKVRHNESNSEYIVIRDIGSGLKYNKPITLEIIDHDGQIMVQDSSSQIEIRALHGSNQTVLGTTVKKVINGVVTFDDLVFISHPGDADIKFEVYSSALNQKVLDLQYGSSLTQTSIKATFRF